eukprot:TRINITY_DN5188_c0_g2_i1.p1 TRINITY_DN5188_c0_g2~~TRINITY_DN5188_c0_g2_i1.p1  ORF type:complete len:291 (-),score=54.37 TRINITY_DN5188_c0_g2_i1:21-893(-)
MFGRAVSRFVVRRTASVPCRCYCAKGQDKQETTQIVEEALMEQIQLFKNGMAPFVAQAQRGWDLSKKDKLTLNREELRVLINQSRDFRVFLPFLCLLMSPMALFKFYEWTSKYPDLYPSTFVTETTKSLRYKSLLVKRMTEAQKLVPLFRLLYEYQGQVLPFETLLKKTPFFEQWSPENVAALLSYFGEYDYIHSAGLKTYAINEFREHLNLLAIEALRAKKEGWKMNIDDLTEGCMDRGLPWNGDGTALQKRMEAWTDCILIPKTPTLKVEALAVYSIMLFLQSDKKKF